MPLRVFSGIASAIIIERKRNDIPKLSWVNEFTCKSKEKNRGLQNFYFDSIH